MENKEFFCSHCGKKNIVNLNNYNEKCMSIEDLEPDPQPDTHAYKNTDD